MSHSFNARQGGITRRPLRALSLAAAIVAPAFQAGARIPADATGYMVEVHTADLPDAGTDSVIKMSLAIRGNDGKRRTLGPWVADRCGVNDHERNQTDHYFFPESTAVSQVEKLRLESDGNGAGPGWLWDTIHVTRIENGRSARRWVWRPKGVGRNAELSPAAAAAANLWVYRGGYSYDFTYSGSGRAIPPNLQTTGGLAQEGANAADKGSVLIHFSVVVPAGPTCPDEVYQIRFTSVIKRVRPTEAELGDGRKRCTFITQFDDVMPGSQRVEKLDPKDGSVVASRDLTVSARQTTNVSFTPDSGRVPPAPPRHSR